MIMSWISLATWIMIGIQFNYWIMHRTTLNRLDQTSVRNVTHQKTDSVIHPQDTWMSTVEFDTFEPFPEAVYQRRSLSLSPLLWYTSVPWISLVQCEVTKCFKDKETSYLSDCIVSSMALYKALYKACGRAVLSTEEGGTHCYRT